VVTDRCARIVSAVRGDGRRETITMSRIAPKKHRLFLDTQWLFLLSCDCLLVNLGVAMLNQGHIKRGEARLVRSFIAVSVLAALWTSGCIDTRQVQAVLDDFDGANVSSLDLEAIVAEGPDVIPFLAGILGQGDRSTRWAALLALAALGHHHNSAGVVLPHLKTALSDPDTSVRVTAAELVASLGDKAGLPVLIDAVDSDEILRPAEPPTPVCTQVIRVLGHYTGQTFTEEADWRAWWDASQENLQWDPDNERFL